MFLPVSVDGGWSPWGNWTRCSKTCGVGYQTQHRTCTNPPPQHGGRDCQGNLDQSRQCEDQKHCPSEFKSQSHFEISWLTIIGLGFRTIWRIMQIVERVVGRGGEHKEKYDKFRQKDILQITVIIRWGAFLLFLLCWGSNLPTDFFFAKRVNLRLFYQTKQPLPQSFSVGLLFFLSVILPHWCDFIEYCKRLNLENAGWLWKISWRIRGIKKRGNSLNWWYSIKFQNRSPSW